MEVGLPQTDIPLALLTFNLGVEAGQLAFVAVVLLAIRAVAAVPTLPFGLARMAPAYLVGTLGAYWLLQRLPGL